MLHRLEILNIRDRYMIGDWVLNNGKPYQWTADDYNRSKMGMEAIKPMPFTEAIATKNGFENKNPDVTRTTLTNDCGLHTSIVFIVPNNRVHIFHEDHKVLNIKCEYTHEFQNALRTCNIYHLAEHFKV